MIKGIGIDILEKKRISLIHAKYGERFENRILGKPFLSLSGKTKTITEKLGIKHLHVSISDTSQLSSAFVIGE